MFLVIAILVCCVYLAAQPKDSTLPASGISLVIDENAVPFAGSAPSDITPEADKGIKIPGYESMYMIAETRELPVMLLNPAGNPCYFTFELMHQETGESLFTSGLVQPAKCLESVRLNRTLDKGEHDITLKIRTYALGSMAAMNNADVRTVLVVI